MEGVENIVTTLPTIPHNVKARLTPQDIVFPSLPIFLHHQTKHLFKDVQVLIHLPLKQPPQVEMKGHIRIGGL